MLTAFNTALSGLSADSTAVSVIGNNIANLNTDGFKTTSVEFADVMSATLAANGSTQLGMGVQNPITSKDFSQQGATSTSTNSLDVAIQGQGFLVDKSSSGATLYTRDGNLQTDANGTLMNAEGEKIQGWMGLAGKINTNAPVGNIIVPTGTLEPAVATANISLNMNLNATTTPFSTVTITNGGTGYTSAPAVTVSAPGGGGTTATAVATMSNGKVTGVTITGGSGYTGVPTLTFTGGAGTGAAATVAPDYSTQIQAFDSLGQPQTLTLNFWNTEPASPAVNANWQWSVSTPNATTASGGSLAFNQQGNLVTPASAAADPVIALTALTDGAANQTMNFNLFSSTGAPIVTQYAQASSTASNTQDGSAPSSVTGVSIGNGGAVLASLSNGQQLQVGQVAVANFVNPGSLIAVGNNDYQVSGSTSQATIGAAGSGGRGQVIGSSLEASTVDISTQFTELMTFQNSYEANSRVITTANTIEQQTVQLIQL